MDCTQGREQAKKGFINTYLIARKDCSLHVWLDCHPSYISHEAGHPGKAFSLTPDLGHLGHLYEKSRSPGMCLLTLLNVPAKRLPTARPGCLCVHTRYAHRLCVHLGQHFCFIGGAQYADQDTEGRVRKGLSSVHVKRETDVPAKGSNAGPGHLLQTPVPGGIKIGEHGHC